MMNYLLKESKYRFQEFILKVQAFPYTFYNQ